MVRETPSGPLLAAIARKFDKCLGLESRPSHWREETGGGAVGAQDLNQAQVQDSCHRDGKMAIDLKISWFRTLLSLGLTACGFFAQAEAQTRPHHWMKPSTQHFFDSWKPTNTHQESLKTIALEKHFEWERQNSTWKPRGVMSGYGDSTDPLDTARGEEFFKGMREISGSVKNANQLEFMINLYNVHDVQMLRNQKFSDEKVRFIKKMVELLGDKNLHQALAADKFLHDLQSGNTKIFKVVIEEADWAARSGKNQNFYNQFLQVWAPAMERVKNSLDLRIFKIAVDAALTVPAVAALDTHRLRRVVRAIGDFSADDADYVRSIIGGTERGLRRFTMLESALGLSQDSACEVSLRDL